MIARPVFVVPQIGIRWTEFCIHLNKAGIIEMALRAHLTVIKACAFTWLIFFFLSYSFLVSRIWMRERANNNDIIEQMNSEICIKKAAQRTKRARRRRWRKAEGNKRCFHVDIFFVNSNKYEYNLGIGTRNNFQSNDIFLFYICFKRNTTGRCN